MIRAELQTILGRRKVLWLAAISALLAAVAPPAVFAVLNQLDPRAWPSIGGATTAGAAFGLLSFVTQVFAVVIAATAGVFDVAQGTLRDRVLTGVSRWRMYLSRVPALLVTYVIVFSAAIIAAALVSYLPHSLEAYVPFGTIAEQAWRVLLHTVVYGLAAMVIGTFVNSLMSANATALAVIFLTPSLFAEVSANPSTLRLLWLPAAVERVGRLDGASSHLLLAVTVIAAWLALLLVSGGIRLQRREL